MPEIKVDHSPSQEKLDSLGALTWPTWSKGVSTFPWTYSAAETCYILDGKVTVTPNGGEPVTVGKGDLVVFPAGMSCTWKVIEPIHKHYRFG